MKASTIITFVTILSALICHAKSGSEIIKENNFKTEVPPLLTTQWTQDAGENSMTPIIGNSHAKTGCGATATAQVMKFWSYPEHGSGCNYYIWDSDKGERVVLYSNFEESYYDWDNMASRYKNNNEITDREIEAVSKLMSDIGIALEMKYDAGGTATNIEYISTVLKKYYGYNPNMTIHRYETGAYTMDEWLTMIYRELSEGRPIIMGGNYGNARHLFVADGYDSEGKVHLNLGKASVGSSCNIDGFYDLTITGETYNQDMRMLIGISPTELPYEIPTFNVPVAGTLKDVFGGEMESRKICMAKIVGTLNASDMAWLKELSAYMTGQLSYIDLSEALIEDNTIADNAFDGCYTLQTIILPEGLKKIGNKAFRNCTGLWHVKIPNTVTEIGQYAFSYCRYVNEIIIPASTTSINANPFRYDKFDRFIISADNSKYVISNGALLDIARNTLYSMPLITIGEYSIENGISIIQSQSFLKQLMIKTLYIPESVTQISSNAFLECVNLENVYVKRMTPPSISTTSFDPNILEKCIIHVPVGSMSAYKSSNWSIFSNIIEDEQCSGINDIVIDQNDKIVTEFYDLNGMKIETPVMGKLYIVKYKDGSVSKQIFTKLTNNSCLE